MRNIFETKLTLQLFSNKKLNMLIRMTATMLSVIYSTAVCLAYLDLSVSSSEEHGDDTGDILVGETSPMFCYKWTNMFLISTNGSIN